MKFYKTIRSENGVSKVEAEGEPWEKNGLTFMLEIPKDVTDCNFYELAGTCNKCVFRHEYGCELGLCHATESKSGLLAASAKSKSALIRALNRLDYGVVRAVASAFEGQKELEE